MSKLESIEPTVKKIMKKLEATRKQKGMTWDELGDWYDKNFSGRRARTLPMNQVFQKCWKSGKFIETPDGGITLKEKE